MDSKISEPQKHTRMKPNHDNTAPHRRTRRDHATETAEDYVEAILDTIEERESCRVVDLAKRFGISHVTVTRTVTRLVDEGLVETEPYRPIHLTAKGKRLAAESRRRHEMVFRFLRALGVDAATAAIDAEGIEHHVSSQTLACFERFVNERGKAEG
ncbi:manganese-binding transcriptional regulator MntR [Candidatus Laterigemmans baculatus]|uniref:manganese-binding transcriptional regulator MntR n=1 Tax=Candidatus Laterigemmans baculatus TaxID=2770505 RepID=UPI0021BCF4F9|nr:manganese-binding transcriptional regulator MntR [Candidatus Laterigemmans baculatus]